jgi:hypothetical protein
MPTISKSRAMSGVKSPTVVEDTGRGTNTADADRCATIALVYVLEKGEHTTP